MRLVSKRRPNVWSAVNSEKRRQWDRAHREAALKTRMEQQAHSDRLLHQLFELVGSILSNESVPNSSADDNQPGTAKEEANLK